MTDKYLKYSSSLIIRLGLILFTIFSPQSSNAQEIYDESVIAWIGEDSITVSELLTMYALTPHIGGVSKNTKSAALENYLYTLIGNKLWADNSAELGVENSIGFRTVKKEIEKTFVLDALYRKEFIESIEIPDSILNKALMRANKTLKIKHLYSNEGQEIRQLHNLLKTGFPFDTLLSVNIGRISETNNLTVDYGQFPEWLEDSLYSLKEGEYTIPIEMEDGYYIFYVENNITNVGQSIDDNLKSKQDAEKVIRSRIEDQKYNKFIYEKLNGLNVDVDKNLFTLLLEQLYNLRRTKIVNIDTTEKYNYRLRPEDVINIEKNLTTDLFYKPFIFFKKDSIDFRNAFRSIVFYGFELPLQADSVVKEKLHISIRKYIRNEVLYRIGIEEGISLREDVQRDIKMWNEYYLAEAAKDLFLDCQEIIPFIWDEYLIKNSDAANGVEFRFDYRCFSDSNKITDYKLNTSSNKQLEIASPTKLKGLFFSAKEKWVPLEKCGAFKDELINLQSGEFLRPIKYDSIYVLIQIIERRMKLQLCNRLAVNRYGYDINIQDKLNLKTIQYAKNTDIKIEYDLLRKIDVPFINTFAIRRLGFGGSISAVPIYLPFNKWINNSIVKDLIINL